MTKRSDRIKKGSRLELVTPRRRWKRFDSVVQHRYRGRALKTPRNTRRQPAGSKASGTTRLNTEIPDDECSDALNWIDTMIKRGRSILSSLTEEEKAFELEIQEERRQTSLHDRLVENILATGDEEISRNGYGTDTSFKNMNSTLYNSVVDSEDVRLDYSEHDGVGKRISESPDMPAIPVKSVGLHSDPLNEEQEDYDERDYSETDASVSWDGLQQNVTEEPVEVLSDTSQESRLSESDVEESYSSEYEQEGEEREEFFGDEAETIRRLSNVEPAEAEAESDDQIASEHYESEEEHELNDMADTMQKEESNEQYVEVLSVDESSEDDQVGHIEDDSNNSLETEHSGQERGESSSVGTSDNLLPPNIDSLEVDRDQPANSSSPSSAGGESPSLSSSAYNEDNQSQKSLFDEPEDIAVMDGFNILGDEDSNHHIDAPIATVDNLQNESTFSVSNEDKSRQSTDDFDYRALAQEARGSRDFQASIGDLNDETFYSFQEKADSHLDGPVEESGEEAQEGQADEHEQIADKSKEFASQVTKSEIEDTKLSLQDLPPGVIDVEISNEPIEPEEADDQINLDVNTSFDNETTIYHSFLGAAENNPAISSPSTSVLKNSARYEIVFANSAYSTTSYEDNENIVEPPAEYVSPLTENPFSIKQDESAYQILQSTLASLGRVSQDQKGRSSSKVSDTNNMAIAEDSPSSTNSTLSDHKQALHKEEDQIEPSSEIENAHYQGRSNDDEISDYVTAVLEASRRTENSSDYERESSVVLVEEMESNIAVASLPVIRTEPSIESMDSMTRNSMVPDLGEVMQTVMATVAESVDESDYSDYGLSNVIQTRPIIEVPSAEQRVASIHEKLDIEAEQLSANYMSQAKIEDELYLDRSEGDLEQSDAQEDDLESSNLGSSNTSPKNDLRGVILEPDSTSRPTSQSRSQSLPRKLLSSPLRALSSIVSGIKEVGNVASEFVRTLDVLGNEDLDEASDPGRDSLKKSGTEQTDDESDNEDSTLSFKETKVREVERADDRTDNDNSISNLENLKFQEIEEAYDTVKKNSTPSVEETKLQETEQIRDTVDKAASTSKVEETGLLDAEVSQYNGNQFVNKSPNVDDSPDNKRDKNVPSANVSEDGDAEEIVVHNNDDDFKSNVEHDENNENDVEDVEDVDAVDSQFKDENPIKEMSSQVSSGINEPLTSREQTSKTIEKEYFAQESELEDDNYNNAGLTEMEGVTDVGQSVHLPIQDNAENEFYSKAKALETVSHIHTLQQLAENFKEPAIQQDQNEESSLQEEEVLGNPIDIEVDPEVEIYIDKASQDQCSIEFNEVPENYAYPAESTMISGPVASTTPYKQESRSTDLNLKETEQDQRPLSVLFDQVRYSVPAYLPSDPPSDNENVIKPEETDSGNKQHDDQSNLNVKPVSPEHEDSAGCYIIDPSPEKDVVKSIPVESAESLPDTRIPVEVEEETPPVVLDSASKGGSAEETGKPLDEPVKTDSEPEPERLEGSTVKKEVTASKLKRARDDTAEGENQRKKNKKRSKGKRKAKKKKPIARKKN